MANNNLLSSLDALGQLQEVNGLWFNCREFSLDGYRFVNCRFDNCQLTLFSSRFELLNCHIDDHTQILYGSDPLKTIKLWNSRNPEAYRIAPTYAPVRNTDGTISIQGT